MDQYDLLYRTSGIRTGLARNPDPTNSTLPDYHEARSQRGHSVTAPIRIAPPLARCFTWVREWRLWNHTTRAGVAWLLACEMAVIVYVGFAIAGDGAPTPRQWQTFAVLAVATAVYMTLTWPMESRNRLLRVDSEHIDHTGFVTAAAALVLPVSLMTVTVILIRIARYWIARKPPARWIFTTASILASCIAAHEIGSFVHLDAILINDGVGLPSVLPAVVAIGAFVAYYGAQTALVGVARGLGRGRDETGHTARRRIWPTVKTPSTTFHFAGWYGAQAMLVGVPQKATTAKPPAAHLADRWSWRATIGGARENLEFAGTLGLGLLAARSASFDAVMYMSAVVLLAVLWTRSSQGAADGSKDATTGIAVRGTFETAASKILANDDKNHVRSAFFLLDIDHFKRVNDTYGHAGGDAVLRAVGRTLTTHTRHGVDAVGRWGGEEFAVVLANTNQVAAEEIADRMRLAVSNLEVSYLTMTGGKSRKVTGVTISIGVAFSPVNGNTVETLSVAADAALYDSKANGRNQVTIAPSDAQPITCPKHPTQLVVGPSAALGA